MPSCHAVRLESFRLQGLEEPGGFDGFLGVCFAALQERKLASPITAAIIIIRSRDLLGHLTQKAFTATAFLVTWKQGLGYSQEKAAPINKT